MERPIEDSEQEGLVLQFVDLMQSVWAKCRAPAAEEWSDVELTMTQAKTLFLLGQGQQRMGDVAGFFGVGLSSATSLIDRLVGKGLVERTYDASDRRLVLCSLTSAGRQEVERFWRVGRAKVESMARLLTTEELKKAMTAMALLDDALTRNMDNDSAYSSEGGP